MVQLPPKESLLKILERLAREGYLQNNRQLDAEFDGASSSRIVELICSMKNLESLNVYEHDLTPDVLAQVFQSCSKLTELHIATRNYKTLEMAEHLINQLRSGFQKLRHLDLVCFINGESWPGIQEMMT